MDAAARKGKHGGRPAVITDDMLHTVLRRRTNGESVEAIRPDPSLASIYQALAEHDKAQSYPEAVAAAHSAFAALKSGDDIARPRPPAF